MGSEAAMGEKLQWPKELLGDRVITLTSSEGQEFFVAEEGARLSPHLAATIDDNDNVVVIALGNVPARALRVVTEYCNKHAAAAAAAADADIPSPRAVVTGISSFDVAPPNVVVAKELHEWDRELVRGGGGLNDGDGVDVAALFDLIVAARFLGLDGLLDAACETVAHTIKDWTPKRIRETFRLPDDLTPAEKEKIREAHGWAFRPDDSM